MDAISNLALDPEILSQLRFSSASGTICVQVLDAERPRRATPEEMLRQITVAALITRFGYPKALVACEVVIQIGINRPRADVVVKNMNGGVHMVFEIKAYHPKDAKYQLSSYMMASGAQFGAVVLKDRTECFALVEGGVLRSIKSLPNFRANNINTELGAPEKNQPSEPTIQPFDSVVRVSKSHLLLSANGESIQMSNVDAASMHKVQKSFLQLGAPLDFRMTSSAKWRETVSGFIAKAAVENSDPHIGKAAFLESMSAETAGAAKLAAINAERSVFLECLRSIDISGGFGATLASAVAAILKNPKESTSVAMRNHLLMSGVRVDPEVILFGNSFATSFFEKTAYSSTWRACMLGLPGASRNKNKATRFVSSSSKCVSIPAHLIVGAG